MVQVATLFAATANSANEQLRLFQRDHPKLKIIDVSLESVDWPGGWFVIITYDY